MTIPEKAASTPILPSITGNAGIDSLLRGAAMFVAAFIASRMVTWLTAHGYLGLVTDLLAYLGYPTINPTTAITGLIASLIIAGLILAWGYINRINAEKVAQVTRTIGVRAGAAQALDPAVPTPPPHTITPPEAQAIVAAYEPAVVTPDLKNPQIKNP